MMGIASDEKLYDGAKRVDIYTITHTYIYS